MERVKLIKNQMFNFDKKMWALTLVDKYELTFKSSLKGRNIVISGASRGIGLEIALRCAEDGANVAILAKSVTEDKRLGGTIFSAAAQIEAKGGKALPIQCDIRKEEDVKKVIAEVENKFGHIDILINNASAISPSPIEKTTMKKFDLMHQVNTRGTFLLTKECLHLLKKSDNAHVLNISPPMSALRAEWLANSVGYSLAKFGMSFVALGLSEELAKYGIAVNALWPKTYIDTAAVRNLLGGAKSVSKSRKPAVMADAAYIILTSDAKKVTGQFFLDDQVLLSSGASDLEKYSVDPSIRLLDLKPDGFL